nr:hypothetical protein Iba_chr15aCG12270 [Ipomoea batatas]
MILKDIKQQIETKMTLNIPTRCAGEEAIAAAAASGTGESTPGRTPRFLFLADKFTEKSSLRRGEFVEEGRNIDLQRNQKREQLKLWKRFLTAGGETLPQDLLQLYWLWITFCRKEQLEEYRQTCLLKCHLMKILQTFLSLQAASLMPPFMDSTLDTFPVGISVLTGASYPGEVFGT